MSFNLLVCFSGLVSKGQVVLNSCGILSLSLSCEGPYLQVSVVQFVTQNCVRFDRLQVQNFQTRHTCMDMC
jgi:hypothetical protein